MGKFFMQLEIGSTTETSFNNLQQIKEAMVHAIFQKIETTGIQDAQDCHFMVWQSIYLEACQQQHTSFAAPLP